MQTLPHSHIKEILLPSYADVTSFPYLKKILVPSYADHTSFPYKKNKILLPSICRPYLIPTHTYTPQKPCPHSHRHMPPHCHQGARCTGCTSSLPPARTLPVQIWTVSGRMVGWDFVGLQGSCCHGELQETCTQTGSTPSEVGGVSATIIGSPFSLRSSYISRMSKILFSNLSIDQIWLPFSRRFTRMAGSLTNAPRCRTQGVCMVTVWWESKGMCCNYGYSGVGI